MLKASTHARIRLEIALVPAYVWVLWACLTFSSRLPDLITDFSSFYTQGAIANSHNARALYDADEQAATLIRVVPGVPHIPYPPVHPPQVSLLFAPLARLQFAIALRVWLAVTLMIYATCGFCLWRACPNLRERRWPVTVLLMAAPPLYFTLEFGQTSAIALALFTAAFFCLRSRRHFLAGLAIGALAYKPPLGIAAAFVFLLAREWRIVIGAIVATAAQVTLAAVYWGPTILIAYVQALQRLPPLLATMEPLKYNMHSWRAFFDLLPLTPVVAAGAYLVAAAGTITLAVVCWRNKGALSLRYSALLIATVLVDPHLWAYDLMILIPAFMLLWDWSLAPRNQPPSTEFATGRLPIGRLSQPTPFQLLLYACFLAPLVGPLALITRVQLSVLLLTMLLLVLHAVLRSSLSARTAAVIEAR